MGLADRRADEMLDRVGLSRAEGHRRVGTYSLGMRQRLGVAHALLGDPDLLILDEPANGLDPAGIRWMRTLLRDFADRGGAVLLSSHQLLEIEVIADHLVIIGGGRVLADGTREELLADADDGLEELFLRLTAADAREDVTR
jgi:ABC-2 type transport system ATP-binding protein